MGFKKKLNSLYKKSKKSLQKGYKKANRYKKQLEIAKFKRERKELMVNEARAALYESRAKLKRSKTKLRRAKSSSRPKKKLKGPDPKHLKPFKQDFELRL